ncbi:MAG: hypothetical protein AB7H71_07920 [Alphaproteobacteria bacterium]
MFYVVDWLPPDFGAVGQYASQHAAELARAGRRVCLIGLTSGAARRTHVALGSGTLETVHLPAVSYDKSRVADRVVWTLSVCARLLSEVVGRRDAYKAELLFTGAPPFFLYFAILAKLARRVRLTYRITDFYPEVLIAEFGDRHPMLSLLRRLTWLLRRRVDRFEALGADQRRILIDGGIDAGRIVVRRDASPVAVTGTEPAAARPPELANRKILLYSGNCGVAHEIDTVIAGLARHHRDGSGRFGLWLNAAGQNVDRFEAGLREARVPVARRQPVPLNQLAGVLRAADAHLITLRPRFSGIVLPSKVYACLATRLPIVFVGPTSSDVHTLCRESACPVYRHVNPGDRAAFAAALEQLADWSDMASAISGDRCDPVSRPAPSGGGVIGVDAIFE